MQVLDVNWADENH